MRVKQHDNPLLPHKPGRMSQVASTGLFIMENLDTSILAVENIYEFMFVLTHHKTRGSTAAWVSLIAGV
jgi:hypothetical protein